MKKLGLLAAVAFLAVSCNMKPGGNHGVLPVEHEAYTADDLHHEGGHGEDHAKHAEEVQADTISTTEKVEEVNDTIKAGN
ncbi:MAG: hypothetical protein KBS93_10535 [Flavobacteriaceae bacterium]|nr:hypothetical protein [Candidatus Onthonaster equi]